ncbi:MAG TPA: hypothetical protein VKU00_14360 [Chthonomonadaceae bacterium]|nr:hypothetical protein [Chthonomonadaceae bacterium]
MTAPQRSDGEEAQKPLLNKSRRAIRIGVILLLGIFLAVSLIWIGYRRRAAQAHRTAARLAHSRLLGDTSLPLPLRLSREQQVDLLIQSLEKRIIGRRASFLEIERTANEIRPIVAAAAAQAEVQPFLKRMAQDEGVSTDTMRARWIALQEADLLLEAGGDPDSLSPARAAGAAQWLPGTGQGVGLKVNLAESERLTKQIEELKRRIAWDVYLQRPDADLSLPGIPVLPSGGVQAELPALRKELETLRARRRGVDERFDPQRAIFAQTRYLLRLYPRFPSADWLFQAYHGGEGGVTHLLKLYLGSAWPGHVTEAIRTGNDGKPLRYEDVYFQATPLKHIEAFSYLYSRSDDHRHYWWKLRASEEALKRFREDPAALKQRWEALLPGRPTEALWYTPLIEDALVSETDETTGLNLIPVRAGADLLLPKVTPELRAAGTYMALRPESLGALRLIDRLYQKCRGIGALRLGDLTYTQRYLGLALQLQKAREAAQPRPLGQSAPLPWPPDVGRNSLPGGGPPFDFDYHTVGAAFDLLRPMDEHARKLLEFSLDNLGERGILTWRDSKDRGERHYHVVPNPRFGEALRAYADAGQSSPLPEF